MSLKGQGKGIDFIQRWTGDSDLKRREGGPRIPKTRCSLCPNLFLGLPKYGKNVTNDERRYSYGKKVVNGTGVTRGTRVPLQTSLDGRTLT